MNIHTSPAAQRDTSRHGGAVSDGALAQEIKYRQDAAGYVAAMLAELRQIAGKAGFDKLVKSLDAAYYDAYGALDTKARESAPQPRNGAADTPTEKTSNSMEPNDA